jgi:LysR family transcriptional activator of nhaA
MTLAVHWLNYHHLLYFWTVAREGSVSAAAERLHLSRATISGQIRQLERALGNRLFNQVGRRLVLTEFGATVLHHADEIFAAGDELQRAVRGATGEARRLVVGVPDVLPKLVVFRLLEPAFELPEPPRVVCREGKLDDLLGDLALHRLDLILSDSPLDASVSIRGFNHKLGECGVTFFAHPPLAKKLRREFPNSLNGAAILLPAERTTLRRLLDRWFEDTRIAPTIVAEFEDSALLKVFGQAGRGAFPAPTIIEEQIIRQYNVEEIGRVESVRERFFAISVERKLKHPAILAILRAARAEIF